MPESENNEERRKLKQTSFIISIRCYPKYFTTIIAKRCRCCRVASSEMHHSYALCNNVFTTTLVWLLFLAARVVLVLVNYNFYWKYNNFLGFTGNWSIYWEFCYNCWFCCCCCRWYCYNPYYEPWLRHTKNYNRLEFNWIRCNKNEGPCNTNRSIFVVVLYEEDVCCP